LQNISSPLRTLQEGKLLIRQVRRTRQSSDDGSRSMIFLCVSTAILSGDASPGVRRMIDALSLASLACGAVSGLGFGVAAIVRAVYAGQTERIRAERGDPPGDRRLDLAAIFRSLGF
jgi:hypothetical protein